MNNILVETSFDYADEFDVEGFFVTTQNELNKSIKLLSEYLDSNGNFEWWFGTNESIYIDDVQEYQSGMTITQLSDDEYTTLKKLFGNTYSDTIEFGTPLIFN